MKTKMTFFLLLLLIGSVHSQTTLITNLQVTGAVSIGSTVTKPWSKVVNVDQSIVITDGKATLLVLRSTVTLTNLTITPTYADGATGPASITGDFTNPVTVQVTHESETKNVEVTVVTIAPAASLPYTVSTLQNWSNTTLGIAPVGAIPHSSNYTALFSYQNAALVFAYDGKADQLKARSWMRSDASWGSGDIFDFEWSVDGQTWTLAKRFDATNPLFCANVASLTGINAQEGYITVPIDGTARYIRARLTATSGSTIYLRDIEVVKQSGRIESINLPGSPTCVSGYIHTLPTASTAGEVDMLLYPFINLSNVAISPVFSNTITTIASLPTNFLNEQTLSVECDNETSSYKVRLKAIRPASETISLAFNATSKQPSNWTAETTNADNYAWSTGWASALFRDKDGITGGNSTVKNAAQFYTTNSCLVFAFDYNAKLSYKLASISTTISSTTRFDVESSVDGIQWTLIKEYISGTTRPTGTEEVYNVPKDHRLVRFKMKNKGTSGNFHLISATIEPRVLTKSVSTLSGFAYNYGSGPSSVQSFNLGGVNLTGYPGNITVTGSTNYEVSKDNISFSGSVDISYSVATLSSTPIYVRLKSGLSAGSYNSETITCSGGGAADITVTASGTVISLPTTYTWNSTGTASVTTSTNWTPERATPASNDILVFGGGGEITVTDLTNQTIGQLVVSNNTNVTLQSSAAAAITISGLSGTDLDIQSGSALNITQSTNSVTITLPAGATGNIAGAVTFNNAAHKLIATDISGISFKNGSSFTAGAGFISNAFGTATANAVIFENGARYLFYNGASPFGLTAPASVVVWQTGSTFVVKGAGIADIENRTYANFELDKATGGSLSLTDTPLTVDNLIITSGIWSIAISSSFTINENLSVASGATLSLSSNVSVPSLTINSGGILNVNAGKQLTVSSMLSNSGTLNLHSDATGTATIITPATLGGTNGIYNVTQYLTSGRNWYISSPVSMETSAVFNPAGGLNKLYWYDEAHGNTLPWSQITTNDIDLATMKGYVVNMSSNGSVTFSGTLNSGSTQTITVNRTSGQAKAGFNLVGNPYPAYLDWNQVTKSNILTSIWQRSQNTGNNYVFDTYNSIGQQYLNNSGKKINNHIPPMQAFWVRVAEGHASGSLTVENTMLSHAGSTTISGTEIIDPIFKSRKTTDLPSLRLQISNGNNTDETLLYGNDNASNEFDDYDSPKLFNKSVAVPDIYTLAGNEEVSINGLKTIPYGQEISLGFSSLAAGTLNINANQISNFDADAKILLKDYLNAAKPLTVDLSNGDSYSFVSDATINNTTRFKLLLRKPNITAEIFSSEDKNYVSVINNRLMINATTESVITVYNPIGQCVMTDNIKKGNTIINVKFAPGVYVVKLNNNAATKVLIN